MEYRIELRPKAVKDLKSLSRSDAANIANALEKLGHDLYGDVKKLTNHSPEYSLRVGVYRVLFEIAKPDLVVVYRVRHRREICRGGR